MLPDIKDTIHRMEEVCVGHHSHNKQRFSTIIYEHLNAKFEVFMAMKFQVEVFWIVTLCRVQYPTAALHSIKPRTQLV